ncbi:MAG: DUF5686 family protein, partial [candidate division Zixibacteria bacterium]|nr:DUF5686 family protein [candidate division Zixibacteria bacterium]
MIENDLKPSETILFPDPIQEWNVAYKQQFSNFGREFWLPVDVRIDGKVKFGFVGLQFPAIGYRQISRLTDYQVNITLPDSLYQSERLLHIDTLSVRQETLFATDSQAIPLSEEETSAYADIDSSDSIIKAFKPSGFLARFVEMDEDDESSGNKNRRQGIFSEYFSFSPQLWYHRVDGGHFGVNVHNNNEHRFLYRFNTGYKTDLKKWSYGGGLTYHFGKSRNTFLAADFQAGSDSRYRSDNYSLLLNSVLPLSGLDDYFDYFWNERFSAEFGQGISAINSRVTLGFRNEKHSSLAKTTDFSIFNQNHIQRENPAVQEGTLRSFTFSIEAGDSYVPFGL